MLSSMVLHEEMTMSVFVPSRGFLFFYERIHSHEKSDIEFSSPHGDFSFSIISKHMSFRPLTGISLFL